MKTRGQLLALLALLARGALATITTASRGNQPGRPVDVRGSMTAADAAFKESHDDSRKGIFFRGDTRPPEHVFVKGFSPRGDDTSLDAHLSFVKKASAYVSVSRSRAEAIRYAFARQTAGAKTGYVYRLSYRDVPDGVWLAHVFPNSPSIVQADEFAVAGAIRPGSIQGVYVYRRDAAGQFVKARWIANPKFRLSYCTISKRWVSSCEPSTEHNRIGASEQPDAAPSEALSAAEPAPLAEAASATELVAEEVVTLAEPVVEASSGLPAAEEAIPLEQLLVEASSEPPAAREAIPPEQLLIEKPPPLKELLTEEPPLLEDMFAAEAAPRAKAIVEATPQSAQLVDKRLESIAAQVAKKNFGPLMEELGYGFVARNQPDIYQHLDRQFASLAEVPPVKMIRDLSSKLGHAFASVVSGALYGLAVHDAFQNHASALDKAAAVTQIVPGVGCAIRAAADIERGQLNGFDTGECFGTDALLFTRFEAVVLPYRIIKGSLKTIEDITYRQRLYTLEKLRERHRRGWRRIFRSIMRHLDSNEFAEATKLRFSSYIVTHAFHASKAAGDLQAGAALLVRTKGPVPAHQERLMRSICREASLSRMRLRKRLEVEIVAIMRTRLHEYNDAFFHAYKLATSQFRHGLGFLSGPTKLWLQAGIDKWIDEMAGDGQASQKLLVDLGEIDRAVWRVVARMKMPKRCASTWRRGVALRGPM